MSVAQSPSSATSSIGSSLKMAGLLAAKQAQKTSLLNITFPSAYRALGRHVYAAKRFEDEFPEMYREFDRLAAEMKAIKTTAAARPASAGFSAKAQALGSGAKDMVQTKALELKVAQTFGRLGETVYAKHGDQSGSPDVIRPIAEAQSQLAALESEIAKLKLSPPTNWKTVRENPFVIGVLLIPCFPVGLALVWFHSGWSKRTKLIWAGSWAALVIIGVAISEHDKALVEKDVKDAGIAWDAGRQADAVDKYNTLLNDHWDVLDESERQTEARRVIEFDVDHGDLDGAKKTIQKAIQSNLSLNLESPEANTLYADARQAAKSASQTASPSPKAMDNQPVAMAPDAGGESKNILSEEQLESESSYVATMFGVTNDEGMQYVRKWQKRQNLSYNGLAELIRELVSVRDGSGISGSKLLGIADQVLEQSGWSIGTFKRQVSIQASMTK